MKELRLLDDLERRTWKRRNEQMETLLKGFEAVSGHSTRIEVSEQGDI